MQRSFLIIIFLMTSISLFSDTGEDNYEFIWPIDGAERGEDILMSPTDQIYNRWFETYVNYGHYLIGAAKGTPVKALCDGTIVDCGYSYLPYSLFIYSEDSFTDMQDLVNEQDPEGTKWINYFLGIKIQPGHIIWYYGLKAPAEIEFRTGDIIHREDILGPLAYSVRSVDQPALDISYSINGRSADIGPRLLGIDNHLFDSTDSERKNLKTYHHSVDELKEVLELFISSLKEGHPALYEYSSKAEIETAFREVQSLITEPLTSDQFLKILMPVIHAIRDNHTYITRDYYTNDNSYLYSPRLYFPLKLIFIDRHCFVLEDPSLKTKIGSEIVAINGDPIGDIIETAIENNGVGDGYITTWSDYLLNYNFGSQYLLDKEPSEGEVLRILFADGSQETYAIGSIKPEFTHTQETDERSYTIDILAEDIILLKINRMTFTDREKEELLSFFIDNDMRNKSVILDLRDNFGGEITDSHFIFSLFTEQSFFPEIERRVNSNSLYSFFRFTDNFSPETENYSDYRAIEGREGFYLFPEDDPSTFPQIEPVSEGHFDGDTYLLTNGGTGSAAVQLTSYFRRFNRGLIIGEEGNGSYHKMNGFDFAQLRLGETGLTLNIPLVHTLISMEDDEINPIGRGIIPDYTVSASLDDILGDRNTILDFTIDLIKQKQAESNLRLILVVAGVILVALMSLFFIKKHSRKKV